MGPFATQILAGLGAVVTKVESPEGDNMRHVGPMRNPGMGHIFLHANRGKRSIVLDLKQPAARDALLRMTRDADVLISNVRPAAMKRLGIDYEALRAQNPHIIYASCCGFGQRGPYAAKPAYDDLIQGSAGVPWLMQKYGTSEPCYAPITLADRVTGLHAAYAVTAALYSRERTGEGQAIEVAMFEAVTQFVLGDHMAGLTFDPPLGDAGYARLLTSHRRPYATKDGHLCVLIYNDKHWKSFFAAIGEPERMERDQRFSTHTNRAHHIDEVYAYVSEVMSKRTTADWQRILDAADIPNMPMNSPQDMLDDRHLREVGFFRADQHPTEGKMYVMGSPTAWSLTAPGDLAPAPRLGEHSIAVLREAGYTEREISALLEAGATVVPPKQESSY